jgi:hypothetical protein
MKELLAVCKKSKKRSWGMERGMHGNVLSPMIVDDLDYVIDFLEQIKAGRLQLLNAVDDP